MEDKSLYIPNNHNYNEKFMDTIEIVLLVLIVICGIAFVTLMRSRKKAR
jgi:hypothetical protein